MEVTKLTLVQAVALQKLAERQVKDAGGSNSLEPGSYDFDFSVSAEGKISKGDKTSATPQFKMEPLYKAILLKYAAGMDDPEAWLSSILNIEGALGAVVQLGPDAVLKTVDENLIALHDRAVSQAKTKFQATAKKMEKSGQTMVVGTLAGLEAQPQG